MEELPSPAESLFPALDTADCLALFLLLACPSPAALEESFTSLVSVMVPGPFEFDDNFLSRIYGSEIQKSTENRSIWNQLMLGYL